MGRTNPIKRRKDAGETSKGVLSAVCSSLKGQAMGAGPGQEMFDANAPGEVVVRLSYPGMLEETLALLEVRYAIEIDAV